MLPDQDATTPVMPFEQLEPAFLETPEAHEDQNDMALRGEPFGYKTGWIAIRTEDTARVIEALGLGTPTQLGWTAGVEAAYDQGVFITPTINGWTLVMGSELLERQVSARKLSAHMGCEVQVFATHQVSDCHMWERASGADDYRLFSIEDWDLTVEGPITEIERELGIDKFLAARASEDFDDGGIDIPDEDTVMNIAGNWSVNPSELSDPDDRLGWYSATWPSREFQR